MNGAQRFAQSACFHQFDHNTIHGPGVAGNIARILDAFINVDGGCHSAPVQLRFQPAIGFHIANRQGLLDQFQLVGRKPGDQLKGLLRSPGGVGVHPQPGIGCSPDRSHLGLGRKRIQLNLDDGIAALAGALGHHLGRINADGKRSLRQGRRGQAKQTVKRLAEAFAPQVMQGHIDSRLGGMGHFRQSVEIIFEGENILAQSRQGIQRCAQAFLGIAVIEHRRRFAITDQAILLQGYEHIMALVASPMRNAEGCAQVKAHRANGQFHRNLRAPR